MVCTFWISRNHTCSNNAKFRIGKLLFCPAHSPEIVNNVSLSIRWKVLKMRELTPDEYGQI